MTIMTNIWVVIQKHCLKIIYHHRIQIPIIESPDIELLCCIKDIDLCIYWSLITIRKKSTSEMMKLSLNFETVSVMNIKWDYNYYQPWSDNEWLVDEMLAILDEDMTMQ